MAPASMRILAWIKLLRLHTSLIYPMMGLAAGLFAQDSPVLMTPVLVPVTSIFMFSVAAYMLNDVFDLGVDRISNTGRPIPAGILSLRSVATVGSASLFAGLILTWLFGSTSSLFIAIAMCGLSVFYSAPPLRLRRFFLAPYLTIASFASLSFLLAGSFENGIVTPRLILGSVLVFGYATGSCMVKEFKDVEGDSRMGIRSLPSVLGVERAIRVTIPAYLGACFLLLPFYWLFDLSPLFLVVLVSIFIAKTKTSFDLLTDPFNVARRMRILMVEVLSTVLVFFFAAISATI